MQRQAQRQREEAADRGLRVGLGQVERVIVLMRRRVGPVCRRRPVGRRIGDLAGPVGRGWDVIVLLKGIDRDVYRMASVDALRWLDIGLRRPRGTFLSAGAVLGISRR